MPRLLRFVLCVLLLATFTHGCVVNPVPTPMSTGDGGIIIFVADHIKAWPQHDESGLSPGQVGIQYDVYLPLGGTWDPYIKPLFESHLRAGKLGGAMIQPVFSYQEVADHPEMRRIAIKLAAPDAGTYWIHTDADVRALQALPGFSFLTVPPPSLAPRYPSAGISFHTVGPCQHATEIARLVDEQTQQVTGWRIHFSEPLGALSGQTVQLPGAETTVSAELVVAEPTELHVVAGTATAATTLDGKFIPGFAGQFAMTGECTPSAGSIALPAGAQLGSDWHPAIDYTPLSSQADSDFYGPWKK